MKNAGTGKSMARRTRRRSSGEWYCNWCKGLTVEESACTAVRYQLKGEAEVTHVHSREHNHNIDVAMDQEVCERFAIHAMQTDANDPQLTPSRYTYMRVRDALLAKMGEDAASNEVNLKE
jgi:hypothetical protein